MDKEQINPENYSMQYFGEVNTKIKDLEERQKMLKNRLLLIGENLIEIKENVDAKMIDLKKEIGGIKEDITKLISFLEMASKEFSKFAKKEELEILSKQAKMFQPLEFVRKKDFEKMKKA